MTAKTHFKDKKFVLKHTPFSKFIVGGAQVAPHWIYAGAHG